MDSRQAKTPNSQGLGNPKTALNGIKNGLEFSQSRPFASARVNMNPKSKHGITDIKGL